MNPKVERLSSDPYPMILIIPVLMLGTKLGTKLGTEPWPWQATPIWMLFLALYLLF